MSGLLMTALHTIDMYDLRGLKFRLSLVSRNAVYLYSSCVNPLASHF